MKLFEDKEFAIEWLEKLRWPEGVNCPRCQAHTVGSKKHKRGINEKPAFQCSRCRADFTVKLGTFMHHSHLPENIWLQLINIEITNPKISSNKLADEINQRRSTVSKIRRTIRTAKDNKDEFLLKIIDEVIKEMTCL